MGDSAPFSDAHRALPTPFLTKTYQLVDDPAIDDIISWNEDGSTFIVWRPAEFARDLLPKYFKHNNFSSFVRQLNTYGFRKIVPDRWEFANDSFRKGEKQLLCDIHRRKVTPVAAAVAVVSNVPVAVPGTRLGSPASLAEDQSFSSSSSHGATPPPPSRGGSARTTAVELTDENERLKKENMHLSNEISQMKKLYNSIILLMSKYTDREKEGVGVPAAASKYTSREKEGVGVPAAAGGKGKREEEIERPASLPVELIPLQLMPMNSIAAEWSSPDAGKAEAAQLEELSRSMRLFGVHIGGKRHRDGDDGAGEQYRQQRRVPEVKSEPMDRSPDRGDGPDQPWMLYSCLANQRVCN